MKVLMFLDFFVLLKKV